MVDNILLKLSEDQKIKRFVRASLNLQRVGQKQLELLKNYERENKQSLRPGFLYFIKTLVSFWENFDFILSLRKGRYRTMAHYPARNMLETLFRMEYYINQERKEQNHIADIETLRIYKRLYDSGVSKQENVQDIEKTYQGFLKLANLDHDASFAINKVDEDRLDPFPKLYQLIQVSKLKRAEGLYFHYRILCEHSHGKLIASIMRNLNPRRSYRQMLMYGFMFAEDMLKIVDYHIQGATKKEVRDAVLKADSIIKATN